MHHKPKYHNKQSPHLQLLRNYEQTSIIPFQTRIKHRDKRARETLTTYELCNFFLCITSTTLAMPGPLITTSITLKKHILSGKPTVCHKFYVQQRNCTVINFAVTLHLSSYADNLVPCITVEHVQLACAQVSQMP